MTIQKTREYNDIKDERLEDLEERKGVEEKNKLNNQQKRE